MFDLEISIVVAQIINFLIIFVIFKKFIADHLNESIRKRQEELEKIKNSHIYYEEKIKDAHSESEKMLFVAKQNVESFVNNSQELASKQVEELLLKANREAEYIVDGGRRQIEKERQEMVQEMKEGVLSLSLKLNEKLFDHHDANEEFIKKELDMEIK